MEICSKSFFALVLIHGQILVDHTPDWHSKLLE